MSETIRFPVRGMTCTSCVGRALTLPEWSADVLVSALSAHHWADLAAAIREIRRVLAPGGTARVYDVRFATYTDEELARVHTALRLPPGAVRRAVPVDLGLVAPFALIEVNA